MLDPMTGAPDLGAPDASALADEIDLGTIAASVQAFGRAGILYGWSVAESTGAAVAKLRLRDGQSAAGSVLARVTLAAGGSLSILPSYPGVRFQAGLYVEVVSGSIEASVYVGGLPG